MKQYNDTKVQTYFLLLDAEKPVSCFAKLTENEPYAFLLESGKAYKLFQNYRQFTQKL